MCLLVLAWQSHSRYRLIIAANRDEFHDRPAAALEKWSPDTGGMRGEILAGRDLQAGGTWLGLNRVRCFGVVTNYRDLQRSEAGAPSRGELIPQYLTRGESAGAFAQTLEAAQARYAGFNLLVSDDDSLWYASNRAPHFARQLPPGVYGLSNHLLDTPWPKLARVQRTFRAWLDATPAPDPLALLSMLADRTPAAEHEPLPETGLSPAWERVLSSPFVLNREYGTRCSTVLLLEPSGAFALTERRFDRDGAVTGETHLSRAAGQW